MEEQLKLTAPSLWISFCGSEDSVKLLRPRLWISFGGSEEKPNRRLLPVDNFLSAVVVTLSEIAECLKSNRLYKIRPVDNSGGPVILRLPCAQSWPLIPLLLSSSSGDTF